MLTSIYGLLLQVVFKRFFASVIRKVAFVYSAFNELNDSGHSVVRTMKAKRCSDHIDQTCYRHFSSWDFPISQLARFTTTTRTVLLIGVLKN